MFVILLCSSFCVNVIYRIQNIAMMLVILSISFSCIVWMFFFTISKYAHISIFSLKKINVTCPTFLEIEVLPCECRVRVMCQCLCFIFHNQTDQQVYFVLKSSLLLKKKLQLNRMLKSY